MKQTVSKIIGSAILMVSFTLVVTSCEKTQNNPVKNNLIESDAVTASSPCGPIPDRLKAPTGNELALQTYGKGVQIYQVQRSTTDPSGFKWAFVSPSATIFANPDFTNKLANHFGGPTWQFIKGFNKGESVVAKKLQDTTIDQTAIPWVLLQADNALSTANNKVTFVQRLCTQGGLAPTTGADEAHLGQLDSVPYTAVYTFYVKK